MTTAIKQIAATAILITFILGATAPTSAQKKNGKGPASAPGFGNVAAITAKQLKDYLTFIASDELEGRDTPSRGLDIAALYLPGRGIKPAGDR